MSADHVLSAKVGDLMTKKVVEIDVGLTADEVARLIAEHKIESFPVTENEKLVGIVTGWDLLTKVVANAMNPGKVRAREFMTRSPITCSPDDSVLQVTKLMTKNGIKHIPVMKEGEVVGIFTTYDVKVFRQLIQQADFSSYTPLSGDEMISAQESKRTEASQVLPGRVATGYRNLDKLLLGGIPENYAVILTSPSCDERDLLIEKFLETGAKGGEATFYVTSNPVEEKALTEKFQSHFYLFICNPQADAITKNYLNVFKIRGVENLTDVNIALASGFHMLDVSGMARKRPRRVCIDIVSDILLQHRAVQTRRWLSALIPELQSKGFTTLAVLDPQMHPEQEVRAVLGLFEGEINIYRKGSKSWLRIRRMRNREYSKSELPLEEA
ncbi:MAG: CBS domain-containing protein [Candidatus Bathyarchaeota archaeon]|jgi:CBS domain-containing protein/KaiC/GvpD/RAD55 family RecA-like ATPase